MDAEVSNPMAPLSNADIEKLAEEIAALELRDRERMSLETVERILKASPAMARYSQTASAVVEAARRHTEDHTLTYEKRPCICSLCEAIRANDASNPREG